jgi:Uma2 family endonuclease
MASVALDPAYRRVTVEEFLAMDLGGAKAELDDGLIYLMAGGTEAHALVAGNVQLAFRTRLRGTGCRTYGSDLAVRTGPGTIRFPDVSVYCSPRQPGDEAKQLIGDPTIVVEVLSPSTARHDQRTKLEEYQQLDGLRAVVFVDPAAEAVRVVQRDGQVGWKDSGFVHDASLDLDVPNLSIPHAEIFARD